MSVSAGKGFTLVELMITIAVLAVLTMAGLPTFMEMIQNMQLRTAAESIYDGMQVARAEAIRRNAYTQFILGPGTGWSVVEINAPKSGAACLQTATIQVRSGAEGSEKATVAVTPAGGATITFTPLGWTTKSCTPLVVDTAIQFNVGSGVLDSSQERPLQVRVTANGGIRMCAPWVGDASDLNPPASASNWQLPATDPRRC
jgi:type IV fimbrial biogenesis protein FimT